MKIAVCIKQVPVSNDVSVDPITHALVRDSSEATVNPADFNALEEAIILKQKTNGQVVVFTMGPPSAEKALRTALSMGCDEACLITDRCFAAGDTVATSKVLVAGIKRYGEFDLILTGALSSDGATAQVGSMVAEYLGIPHISEIRSLCYHAEMGQTIEATKNYLQTTFRMSTTLPALLTVSFGCNEPRLTTLRSQQAARKKEITVYSNAELQMKPTDVGLPGSPTMVVDSWQPENVKKASFLSGNAEELAKTILDLIEKEKGAN